MIELLDVYVFLHNWPVRQVVVKKTTAVDHRPSGPNSISGLKTYFTGNKDKTTDYLHNLDLY